MSRLECRGLSEARSVDFDPVGPAREHFQPSRRVFVVVWQNGEN
jgi:hypothetical protein